MRGKWRYLITVEYKRQHEDRPVRGMSYYTLTYCLNSAENINRFLRMLDPRGRYVYIAILFILELTALVAEDTERKSGVVESGLGEG